MRSTSTPMARRKRSPLSKILTTKSRTTKTRLPKYILQHLDKLLTEREGANLSPKDINEIIFLFKQNPLITTPIIKIKSLLQKYCSDNECKKLIIVSIMEKSGTSYCGYGVSKITLNLEKGKIIFDIIDHYTTKLRETLELNLSEIKNISEPEIYDIE